MFELRPYQKTIIQQVRQLLRQGTKSVLIQSATGSGKTCLTAHMLGVSSQKGIRSWFIVHRRELIMQSARTFAAVGIPCGIIASGFPEDSRPLVQIASIQTLARRLGKVKRPKLIVWDECVAGDTEIITDLGKMQIKDIPNRKPKYVLSYDGISCKMMKITSWSFKGIKSTIKITTSKGQSIICTPEHKVYSNGKWVESSQLKKGDSLTAIADALRHCPVIQNSLSYVLRIKEKLSIVNGLILSAIKDLLGGIAMMDHFKKVVRVSIQRVIHIRKTRLFKNFSQTTLGDVQYVQQKEDITILDYRFQQQKNLLRKSFLISRNSFITKSESVVSIEANDDVNVYDIGVEDTHCFFGNGLLVHNCHHLAAKSWSTIHAEFSEAIHIGLTATPHRLDGTGLGRWFPEMVQGPSVSELIRLGYLANYKAYAPSTVDTSEMHLRMGDYVKEEMVQAVDKPTITGDVISHYVRLAAGKRALVFAASIRHSNHIVAQFLDAGIKAEHVDGDTESRARDGAMKRFAAGETSILSNVDLFGEGLDIPGIEAVILLRPTTSLVLAMQQIGRALRPAEGKSHAIILDHVGNLIRHGLPDEDREWSQEGTAKRKRGDKENEPSVRTCPECFACMESGVTICEYCQHIFEIKGRKIGEQDGILVEVDPAQLRRQRKMEQGRAHSLEELIAVGKQRKYKNPYMWAKYVIQARTKTGG